MIGSYIGRILSCSINNDIENELVIKIIKLFLDKIPVQLTKNWLGMVGFNYFIFILVFYSDKIKKYFINNEIISKLIDLIMGKESPLYQGDERNENKNNRPKFGYIVESISLLYKYYTDNYQKEELNLSKNDLLMINTIMFYEKVILNEIDSYACKMLIANKMNLDEIINKGEKQEEFFREINEILIILKLPSLIYPIEVESEIDFMTYIITKYAEIYKIKDDEENVEDIINNINNKEKFLEKLNILLGIAIPNVKDGIANIIYISGKYHDKYSLLAFATNFSINDKKEESLRLLRSLFNLFNINKLVFDYIDKLPSPNSSKYSFVDYCLKIYFLLKNNTEDDWKTEIENLNNEVDVLVAQICSKYNKDLDNIKNNNQINIDNSIYFFDCSFNLIKETEYKTVNLYKGILYYISTNDKRKTDLPCFNEYNFFKNLNDKNVDEKVSKKDGYEVHSLACIVLSSNKDQDINIDFKPYFSSTMVIKAKTDNYYFLFCFDINDNIKNDENEINNLFDFSKINIKTEYSKIQELPMGNNNQISGDDGCSMNCPICRKVNVLNERNTEFKYIFL